MANPLVTGALQKALTFLDVVALPLLLLVVLRFAISSRLSVGSAIITDPMSRFAGFCRSLGSAKTHAEPCVLPFGNGSV